MKLYKAAHTIYKTQYRKEDFGNRSKKLSKNKTSGNKEILS